jgi:hypothetical protein
VIATLAEMRKWLWALIIIILLGQLRILKPETTMTSLKANNLFKLVTLLGASVLLSCNLDKESNDSGYPNVDIPTRYFDNGIIERFRATIKKIGLSRLDKNISGTEIRIYEEIPNDTSQVIVFKRSLNGGNVLIIKYMTDERGTSFINKLEVANNVIFEDLITDPALRNIANLNDISLFEPNLNIKISDTLVHVEVQVDSAYHLSGIINPLTYQEYHDAIRKFVVSLNQIKSRLNIARMY